MGDYCIDDDYRHYNRNSNRESNMTLWVWIGIVAVFITVWSIIAWEIYTSPMYDQYGRQIDKKQKHNRHYNSLDPDSPYSERECIGKDCGCNTDNKQVDMNSTGDM